MPSVIPHDLVPEIVRYLRDDIATLRSANLVCHEWHHWVSPVVMRSVAVVRGPALGVFVSWATSADRIVGTRDPLDHILQFILLAGEPPKGHAQILTLECSLIHDTLTLECAQFIEAMRLLRAVRVIRMDPRDIRAMQQFYSPRRPLLQHEVQLPWQMFLDAHLERQNTIQSLLPMQQAFFYASSFSQEFQRQFIQLVQEWPRKHLIKAVEVHESSLLYDRELDAYDNLAILNMVSRSGFPVEGQGLLALLVPAKNLIALQCNALTWRPLKEACFTSLQFDNLRFISLSINAFDGDEGPSESMDGTLMRILQSASNLDTVRVKIIAWSYLDFDSLYDVFIEGYPRLVAIQIGFEISTKHIRRTPTRASLDAITHLHVSDPVLLRYILDECPADWFARLRTLVITLEATNNYDRENYGDSFQAIGAIVNMLRDIEFLDVQMEKRGSRDSNSWLELVCDFVDKICSDCQRLSSLDLAFWQWNGAFNGVDFRPPLIQLLQGCRSLKRVVFPYQAHLDPDCKALAQSRGVRFVDDLGEGVFSVFRDQDRILGLN